MKKIDGKLDMKILSSSHLNFLFGSGVNGKAFPQFDGFTKTLNSIKNVGAKSKNLEQALNEVENKGEREKILETFKDELKVKNDEIKWNDPSIANIKGLFSSIN